MRYCTVIPIKAAKIATKVAKISQVAVVIPQTMVLLVWIQITSEGGKAAHEKGTAHEFDSEEAKRVVKATKTITIVNSRKSVSWLSCYYR